MGNVCSFRWPRHPIGDRPIGAHRVWYEIGQHDLNLLVIAPGRCFILHPRFLNVVEQTGLSIYHLETQAFLTPTLDMDSFDLAALYALQHSLPGDAK